MKVHSLNAVDTRRWAQTERQSRDAGRPEEGSPTREEEQRYSQTTPQPVEPTADRNAPDDKTS